MSLSKRLTVKFLTETISLNTGFLHAIPRMKSSDKMLHVLKPKTVGFSKKIVILIH